MDVKSQDTSIGAVGSIDAIYPNPTYQIENKSEANNGYIDKLLIEGYVRNENISSEDIIHMIYLFSLNIKSRSMTLIAATYLFASTIDTFINSEQNKCEFEFTHNKDDMLNILQYIFVRGGMCRDLLLNQDIKDIDIVVNIHELSKAYLSHLTKFHSKKEQQHENVKCIFWKHYLNKHKEYDPTLTKQIKRLKSLNDQEFQKLVIFEKVVEQSEYLLNAKFIKSIVFGTELFKNAYNCKGSNKFYSQQLNLNKYFEGLSGEVVQFDVVDQIGCHDNYRNIVTMESYRKAMGDASVEKALKYINEYNFNEQKLQSENISIPIYPFESTVNFYDCTINCMHIDLYHVLKDKRIDLLWKRKIINTKYSHDLINKYNRIAFEDLNNKILRAANLNVITTESAEYYFWRIVKMVTKFIDKLISEEWCIDESYLNTITKYYDVLSKSRIFHTKCFYHRKGGVGNIEEINKRFVVFRYIKFEEYLKSKWEYHGSRFEKVLMNRDLYSKRRQNMLQCFQDFGYPSINVIEIPKGYLDHIYTDV